MEEDVANKDASHGETEDEMHHSKNARDNATEHTEEHNIKKQFSNLSITPHPTDIEYVERKLRENTDTEVMEPAVLIKPKLQRTVRRV